MPNPTATQRALMNSGLVPTVDQPGEHREISSFTASDAPNPSPREKELAAIQKAYEDQLGSLYKVLVANLASLEASHDTEQGSVEKFKRGLQLSRRARDLALQAANSG